MRPGERATLAGWIHRRRVLASVTFLVLRDRSGLAQVVVKDRETVEQLAGLPEETVVEVTGTVSANESAPGGAELVEPVVTALTEPALAPPTELWRPTFGAGLPTHLDHAAVTLRHPRHRAAWQLASASMRGFRTALGAREFTEIATPKLVGTATESGANVFTVDYFGRTAYLAQSPQLYKQMLVGVFERVFEVGPVFRAEPHDTVRHLAQYTSLDAELGFIRDHRDVLAVLREAIAGMVEGIREYAPDAAALLGVELPQVPEEFPVIHFSDALRQGRRRPGRARPQPGARARAQRVGQGGIRLGLPCGGGLPDGQAALLHAPAAGRRAVEQQLRPALPGPRADDRRAAPAPAVGLRRGDASAPAPTPRSSPATSTPSPTACLRTAGSPSVWRGGSGA